MKELIFVRHAKALGRKKTELLSLEDSERPLTKKGIEEFQKHVLKNKKSFQAADLFVTSPYLRAVETLDVLLKALKVAEAPITVIKRIRPDDTFEYLAGWLRKRKEKKIVIVTHEPFISFFLENLVFSNESALHKQFKIKKGAIVSLSYNEKNHKYNLESVKNP